MHALGGYMGVRSRIMLVLLGYRPKVAEMMVDGSYKMGGTTACGQRLMAGKLSSVYTC
jgi:hypothetical protein